VVGVILGLAAQRSLATLFAGLQIAFTQPIRMGDVLIVEGEWGWVEEITLTYVVIKIWDLRRLVVPVTYFLEKPFQNWTRASSSLLGTVFLNLDYTVPSSSRPRRSGTRRCAGCRSPAAPSAPWSSGCS
jgi:small-conductance mechanosensitive channel